MEDFKNYERKLQGFPCDDEHSLMLDDGGSANLDIFYSSQFVQNEQWTDDPHKVMLEHTPVLAGTMTGTVHVNGQPVQTFSFNSQGVCTLTDIQEKFMGGFKIARYTPKVTDVKLNHITGELFFDWDRKPDNAYFTFNYEFNMECAPATKLSTVTLVMHGSDSHLLVMKENGQPNFLTLQEFSPIGKIDHTGAFYYRVICYGVAAEQLAMVANRLYAVDAAFDVFNVDVPKGCGQWGIDRSPELKVLFSNDPSKKKPNFINHAREPIPDRCPATDS